MGSSQKSLKAAEFGDFQTPVTLAKKVCKILSDRGLAPASVVEPTCGFGNFLLAALAQFPTAAKGLGVEINPAYVEWLKVSLRTFQQATKVRVLRESFFDIDWAALLRDLPEPLLVIGNPPWVTNSQLGVLGSQNLPTKTNFQKHNGLDAITGKSNFDISEWMLIKLLEMLDGRKATMAMLCKTAVARKVLMHAWENKIGFSRTEILSVDAGRYFDAAVDACLLVCWLSPSAQNQDCLVYLNLGAEEPVKIIGNLDGRLIADVAAYNRWKHLEGDETYKWRSGVKHDCSKIMELRKEGNLYRNGLGELVELEEDFLYPMLKSSALANGRIDEPRRWMLVTQRTVGEDTAAIQSRAPKTWKYLWDKGKVLDRRASSIYRNRPRFSVFGVGDYSFSPWKVAISGFYKKLKFTAVPNFGGKPIMLDDTAYFVPCHSEQEARFITSLLNSDPAREFFCAFVFWDAKRPITVDLLRRLDLKVLARELGREEEMIGFLDEKYSRDKCGQQNLWTAAKSRE